MFKKLTVDAVLKQFTNAVADLRKVQGEQENTADLLASRIDGLTIDRAVALREAHRADTIAKKIEALLA